MNEDAPRRSFLVYGLIAAACLFAAAAAFLLSIPL